MMKKFLIKLLAVMLIPTMVIILLNTCYVSFNKTDPDYIKKFKSVPSRLDVCNFGSSHGLYGYNYNSQPNGSSCFNFGLVSQSLDYDYRIMQQYQHSINEKTVVYITVSYFSLFGLNESDDKDFEAKNKRYYSFLQPELIKKYDDTKYYLINYFPVLLSPRNISKLVMGKLAVNENDKEWSKDARSVDVNKDALAAYGRHIVSNKFDKDGKRIINEDAINSLCKMIDICKGKGAKPILITTPYLSEYTTVVRTKDKKFYIDFYALVNKLAKEKDVPYYDYGFDKRFCSNYELFMNADHLNKAGALLFTDIILKETLNP